jgi:RecA/RadA recombinase
MAKKPTAKTTGSVSLVSRLRSKFGADAAFSMSDLEDLDVKEWIPTGSTVLDATIRKGGWGGYPVGRVSTLSAEESVGKTYLALSAAAAAQKMGITVVYMDSEFTPDKKFYGAMGITEDETFVYQPAPTIEDVDNYVDEVMTWAIETKSRVLFIWDSVANTGTKNEADLPVGEKGKNRGDRAIKISELFRKNVVRFGLHQCTMLLTNQIKDKVDGSVNMYTPAEDKHTMPGGRGIRYNQSLHLRLTRRKASDAMLKDENDYTIGTEVRAEIFKSRFGTYKRLTSFMILWGAGADIRVWDEYSWLEAIQHSPFVRMVKGTKDVAPQAKGAKKKKKRGVIDMIEITTREGEVISTPGDEWLNALATNSALRDRVLELIEEEQITKFAQREGNAKNYYSLDGEESTVSDFVEDTGDDQDDE